MGPVEHEPCLVRTWNCHAVVIIRPPVTIGAMANKYVHYREGPRASRPAVLYPKANIPRVAMRMPHKAETKCA